MRGIGVFGTAGGAWSLVENETEPLELASEQSSEDTTGDGVLGAKIVLSVAMLLLEELCKTTLLGGL